MLSTLQRIEANPETDNESKESDDEESIPKQSMSLEAMQKLNDMRVNNLLCDASIKLGDGTVFNVHRAILSACSDYFKTCFTTTLNDVPRTETLVVGVSSKEMEIVIKYAYLRDLSDIDKTNVVEIMIVSDYFGMLGLMKFCINFIINMLSSQNCIIFWLMSRYRSIPKLMEKSRYYILQNFPNIAEESKTFLELNDSDFLSIINDELLNVNDESIVWEAVIRWIDHKPEDRKQHLTTMMKAVRLGLLSNGYFMDSVKKNRYVEKDPEARPIILETMRFLCDLDIIDKAMVTPQFAIPRLPHDVIFAIGGWSEGSPLTTIESYDTRADRWVHVPEEDPAGARSYHGTAVIGTKLYCIGGFNGREYFNTCSRFDAFKKKWQEVAPMHTPRCYVSVAALDGKIYALGGYDGHSRHKTGESYSPISNQWTMISPMHQQRSDASACAFDGKIYIVGGFNGQECLNTAEYYTPQTNSWTMLPPMISRRSGVSCVAHRGFLYVIGGFNGLSRMNTGEKYDPDRQTWTSIKEMYNPRSNFGLEIIDDMIFATGGFNGVVTISHSECYVPGTDEWLEATDMNVVRSALTANVVTGLPNIRDYLHKERDKLVEDRHLRTLQIDSETARNINHNHFHSSYYFRLPIRLGNEESDGTDSDLE